MKYGLAYVTVPNTELAKKIARICLQKKIVACANIIPTVVSLYWWKGQIQEDSECVLVMKVPIDQWDVLLNCIKEHHTYECSCITLIPFLKIDLPFLKWLDQSLN